jgi:hypothetical protein
MTSRILAGALLLGLLAVNAGAQEPPWDPSVVKPCDGSNDGWTPGAGR